MSHVITAEVHIKNLDALAAAAAEIGGQLVRGVTNHKWYGHHVGDYPVPTNLKRGELGTCDHVIRFPGINYEVGVVNKGDHFILAYDFYGSGRGGHDGQLLRQKVGDGAKKLAQLYGVHVTSAVARSRGWSVNRTKGQNGSVNLQIRVLA